MSEVYSTDSGVYKTDPLQADKIRKGSFILIEGRPCKVVEVSTLETGECHFVAIDIFTSKNLEETVPSSHMCEVPYVRRTEYHLLDISEDGFVRLMNDYAEMKEDLKLPTDDSLTALMKSALEEGKDVMVCVMSCMGEEQIYTVNGAK